MSIDEKEYLHGSSFPSLANQEGDERLGRVLNCANGETRVAGERQFFTSRHVAWSVSRTAQYYGCATTSNNNSHLIDVADGKDMMDRQMSVHVRMLWEHLKSLADV